MMNERELQDRLDALAGAAADRPPAAFMLAVQRRRVVRRIQHGLSIAAVIVLGVGAVAVLRTSTGGGGGGAGGGGGGALERGIVADSGQAAARDADADRLLAARPTITAVRAEWLRSGTVSVSWDGGGIADDARWRAGDGLRGGPLQ